MKEAAGRVPDAMGIQAPQAEFRHVEHQQPKLWDNRAAFVLAVSLYTLGIVLRYEYIFHWHRATEYIFSDMLGYYQAAKDFCNPDFVSGYGETVHPPGTRFFFGTLMALDPSLHWAAVAQFVLSCLVPLLLAGIAWDLFGRRPALCVWGMASLYFPFFDYAGYILSEAPFLFTLVCSFWLLVRSLRTKGLSSVFLGVAAGVVLGCAAAFKSVALPAAFLVLLALVAVSFKYRLRFICTLVAAVLGLALIVTPLAIRATKLSEGNFCLIANDAARNVLMGHYGTVGRFIFHDEKRGSLYDFGSPSAAQKGQHDKAEFPVGVYENGKIMEYAWAWIREHPVEAVLLSFEHLCDLAFNTAPWPTIVLPKFRPWVQLFHEIFLVLVLFPAGMHLCLNAKELFLLRPRMCGDLLVLMPVLAIGIAAFISLGEPRYRIPFDGFLLLLAARAYCGRGTEGETESKLVESALARS